MYNQLKKPISWHNYGYKIANIKCFGNIASGFDHFKLINIVIGKNNAGKSTLLDMLELATLNEQEYREFITKNTVARSFECEFIIKMDDENIKVINDFPALRNIVLREDKLIWKIASGGNVPYLFKIGGMAFSDTTKSTEALYNGLRDSLQRKFRFPLHGIRFIKLNAERNIVTEQDDNAKTVIVNNIADCMVLGDGTGAVKLMQRFANWKKLPRSAIENELLEAINNVCFPDIEFKRVFPEYLDDRKTWEIYLYEGTKDGIALSQSGAGLKTVILATLFLHLLPKTSKTGSIEPMAFVFEEPENNMHPAMLRRLLKHIALFAITNDMPVFIATHSSVAIDMFMNDENAQIIHVKHDGQFATCSNVTSFLDGKSILDDIGAKASDLLQANGLIWVEGPSDAIYINHWIRLWSNVELRQGRDYQCVFYGGRLLAHLAGEIKDDPEEDQKLINTIMINPNAIYLMDSDNKSDSDKINSTKTRIIGEAERSACFAWVTDGREIENYIPQKGVSTLLDVAVDRDCGRYDSFFDYLDGFVMGSGKKFRGDKVVMATLICQKLPKKSDWEGSPGLDEKMKEVIAKIEKWNN